MNERVVTELVIDARPSTAGAAEYERAMAKASVAVEKLKAKSLDLRLDPNLPRSVDRVSQAYDKLRGSIDPVVRAELRAEQEIRKGMALVDRAVMTGVATQQQASATISALRQKQVADINKVRQAQISLNSTPAVPQGGAGSASGDVVGAGAIGGVAALRGVLGPLAGVLSVRQVGEWADSWTQAGNQLRAVSQITGMQTRSLEQLNDMAKQSRSGFAETVDLYAKLVRSSSGVAKSEQEIATATDIVNKAFKAGGSAASEQAAGILQLSQALGSGFLQGDELRSLRENAPLIAKAIADEFHTTIGGLKALGAEGVLTSDRIFKAILNSKGEIDKAFDATTGTLADGFTALGNQAIETIGHLDKVTHFTRDFTTELNHLSGAIDAVGSNPNLDNVLSLFSVKIVEGGLIDQLRDGISANVFDGTITPIVRDAAKIKDEIAGVQNAIDVFRNHLAQSGLADNDRIELNLDTADAMGQLKALEAEMAKLRAAAEKNFKINFDRAALAQAFREAENASMDALRKLGQTEGGIGNLPGVTGSNLTSTTTRRTIDKETGVGVTSFSHTDATDIQNATKTSGDNIRSGIDDARGSIDDLNSDTGGYFDGLGQRIGSLNRSVDTGTAAIRQMVQNGIPLDYASIEAAVRTGFVSGRDDSLLGRQFTSTTSPEVWLRNTLDPLGLGPKEEQSDKIATQIESLRRQADAVGQIAANAFAAKISQLEVQMFNAQKTEQHRDSFLKFSFGVNDFGNFADGGSFTVPGASRQGDKTRVQLNANAGERVSVTPAGQDSGGTVNIYYTPPPGESMGTSQQRMRVLMDEGQRAQARR